MGIDQSYASYEEGFKDLAGYEDFLTTLRGFKPSLEKINTLRELTSSRWTSFMVNTYLYSLSKKNNHERLSDLALLLKAEIPKELAEVFWHTPRKVLFEEMIGTLSLRERQEVLKTIAELISIIFKYDASKDCY